MWSITGAQSCGVHIDSILSFACTPLTSKNVLTLKAFGYFVRHLKKKTNSQSKTNFKTNLKRGRKKRGRFPNPQHKKKTRHNEKIPSNPHHVCLTMCGCKIFQCFHIFRAPGNLSHTIHVCYIYLHEWLIFMGSM